jgi:hypothetical protein
MNSVCRPLACLVVCFATIAALAPPIQAQEAKAFEPPLQPFGVGGRVSSMREKLLQQYGGTAASEAAVARGVKWLAAQQRPDGSWKFDGDFPDKGQGSVVAATGLGLLAILGTGRTHRDEQQRKDWLVGKAINFLAAAQNKKTGAFDADMKAHSLATMAFCEAYALTGDFALKKPAQIALNHLVDAQHTEGGWGTQAGKPGDTSTTGWAVMALKTGLMANLEVPTASLTKAQKHFDGVAEPATEGYGLVDAKPTPTMTAIALHGRQILQGWGGQNLRMIKGIDNYVKPNYPRQGRKDAEFVFFGTQVMFHFGGFDWKSWNEKMREIVKSAQDTGDGPATAGSWSPQGDPLAGGGRLAVTALNMMSLETYYRQLPMHWKKTN